MRHLPGERKKRAIEFFFAISVAVACAICIFCSTARAAEPGHGHTSLIWDWQPSEDWPTGVYFEVMRSLHGVEGSGVVIGTTEHCNVEAYTDEEGFFHPKILCKHFPLLFAELIPREGVTCDYQIRAIAETPLGARGASDWSPAFVIETQDPTTCYTGGLVISCPYATFLP